MAASVIRLVLMIAMKVADVSVSPILMASFVTLAQWVLQGIIVILAKLASMDFPIAKVKMLAVFISIYEKSYL